MSRTQKILNRLLSIIVLQIFFFYPFSNRLLVRKDIKVVYAAQDVLTGSGTWTTPQNVFSITIECWGGGGGGASGGGSNLQGNGGGGGGAYSQISIANPATSYTYSVGAGGTGGASATDNATAGGASTINSTLIVAGGGQKGNRVTGGGGNGGAGGTATGGDVNRIGGNGANGATTYAGGGGGGAGSTGVGKNAVGTAGGEATSEHGGAGGTGTTANNGIGTVGGDYGGGGASSTRTNAGRDGGPGLIRITYTVNTSPTVALNTLDAHNFGTDQTPTLEFTGTDPDGDRITYNIQIDTVDTFNSANLLDKVSVTHLGFANTVTPADTDPFLSGQKIAYTVQSGDALDFGTYYWRVRGKDPQRTDTYGSWSSTRTFIIDAGISIIITTDGTVDYGPITAGESKSTIDLTDTQTIQNNGSSTINLNISTSNAVGDTVTWTLGSTVGATDVFVHEFSSNAGTDWTKFTTPDVYQLLSSGLAPEGTQDFDLRITVPSIVSDYGIKTISISVQGVLP